MIKDFKQFLLRGNVVDLAVGVVIGASFGAVVTSAHDQERGLGGRTALPENYAMLFAFDESDKYGFWMKDMLIPIDIIWVTETGTVVAVDAKVSPATYPKAFYPPVPVKYVVETRAGLASVKGWKIGSHISLPPPYGR